MILRQRPSEPVRHGSTVQHFGFGCLEPVTFPAEKGMLEPEAQKRDLLRSPSLSLDLLLNPLVTPPRKRKCASWILRISFEPCEGEVGTAKSKGIQIGPLRDSASSAVGFRCDNSSRPGPESWPEGPKDQRVCTPQKVEGVEESRWEHGELHFSNLDRLNVKFDTMFQTPCGPSLPLKPTPLWSSPAPPHPRGSRKRPWGGQVRP